MRYIRAAHGIAVGARVSMFEGGRKFLGTVTALLDYEGSGLTTIGGLLQVDGPDWPVRHVGWGAVEVLTPGDNSRA